VAITVFSRAELSRLKLLLRYSEPTASRVHWDGPVLIEAFGFRRYRGRPLGKTKAR
jgi:hypothetical protein